MESSGALKGVALQMATARWAQGQESLQTDGEAEAEAGGEGESPVLLAGASRRFAGLGVSFPWGVWRREVRTNGSGPSAPVA